MGFNRYWRPLGIRNDISDAACSSIFRNYPTGLDTAQGNTEFDQRSSSPPPGAVPWSAVSGSCPGPSADSGWPERRGPRSDHARPGLLKKILFISLCHIYLYVILLFYHLFYTKKSRKIILQVRQPPPSPCLGLLFRRSLGFYGVVTKTPANVCGQGVWPCTLLRTSPQEKELFYSVP